MARSRSALLTLAAIAALAGCCVCAPQGSVQGGVQGGAQVPPGVPHSTAPPAGVGGVRRGRGYRDWRTRGDPTLINSLWRSRQPLGIRKQLEHMFRRKRGGIHNPSTVDRLRDRGGGVLAVRQLLVAGAGGRPGGRLTRGGGRVHACVAPAVRGRQRVARGLPVARSASARADARARASARRDALLPRRRRLPCLCLRHPPTERFLTGVLALLLSVARKD